MARPYWLLSLIPVIGVPLAFLLQNRALIRRSVVASQRGYRAGGLGGGIVGAAEGLGRGAGTDNPLGEAIDQVAGDPSSDPRLKAILHHIDGEPDTPK